MLTYEEARDIGVNACVDKLGREFVNNHKENATKGYGDAEDFAFCFVGIDDRPMPDMSKPENRRIVLDGSVTFLDCALPDMA